MKRTITQLVFSTLMLMIGLNHSAKAQLAPDFNLTDIDGNQHKLYEDYLTQGKTVLISFSAPWNPWDEVWISSGVLQDFYAQYGGSQGEAAVFFIDPTGSTVDDLMGVGNGGTGYDFTDGNEFPFILTQGDSMLTVNFEVNFFPSIRMICPDGTMYTDNFGGNSQYTELAELSYGELTSADVIAELMGSTCGTVFEGNILTGTVYHDQNGNCEQDTDDDGAPNLIASIAGPNGTFNRITSSEGIFRSTMNQGTYDVSVEAPNDLWSVCNNNQTITYSGTDEELELEFGLQAEDYCPHPSLSISSPRLRRCFDSYIYVDYCNEGTEPLNDAIVTVNLHDLISITSSNIPYTQNGNEYTFDIGTLEVFECGKIKLVVLVDCDAELGLEICYDANITDPCNGGSRAYESECQEVIGSYDPNDKRAFPLSGSDEYEVLPNTTIKYQIRFQNTGTDTAFNVLVEDVISDLLDLSTLTPGASSHPFEMEVNDGRQVSFRFDNIMLPDSNVDLLGSNGFFTYYIDQVPDLSNGTEILNTAGIFFDFNEAIITNTTTHIIDDGIVNTEEIESDLNFSITPNPATEFVTIDINANQWSGGRLAVYDITGNLISSQAMNDNQAVLKVNHLETGIYLVKLTNQEGNYIAKKLVVKE